MEIQAKMKRKRSAKMPIADIIDLYINPCKLEFLILLNPSSVSPDADNITRCAFRNLCYEIYDQETMTQKRVTLQRSYTKFK